MAHADNFDPQNSRVRSARIRRFHEAIAVRNDESSYSFGVPPLRAQARDERLGQQHVQGLAALIRPSRPSIARRMAATELAASFCMAINTRITALPCDAPNPEA